MNNKKSKNLSYTLFLYREELRRRNSQFMRLSKTKISLTDGLISKTLKQLPSCSAEQLQHVNREMAFKQKLKYKMQKLKTLQRSGQLASYVSEKKLQMNSERSRV